MSSTRSYITSVTTTSRLSALASHSHHKGSPRNANRLACCNKQVIRGERCILPHTWFRRVSQHHRPRSVQTPQVGNIERLHHVRSRGLMEILWLIFARKSACQTIGTSLQNRRLECDV